MSRAEVSFATDGSEVVGTKIVPFSSVKFERITYQCNPAHNVLSYFVLFDKY